MTETAIGGRVPPPWNSPGFFSETDLRAAQEYYFQTHATHSRMIAQGRNAQGFMKSLVRKKLAKEIGEDFKMYTGKMVGEGGDGDVSQGIRGELNALLLNVYNRIAPTQPVTSPAQEDVAILLHPHGALEVCYAMVWYYTDLLKRHASIAGNRRKVLKNILDEELFKWIWRMTLGYLLSNPAKKALWKDAFLSAGLPYIPTSRQRAHLPLKLFEIGEFLLGKTIAESSLRFPLCYYFVTYLRVVQEQQLGPGALEADALYTQITQRTSETHLDSLLVAVDVLMNMTGNSMNSFDDVLANEAEEVPKFIPPQELDFIRQFDRFATEGRIAATLKELVPVLNREDLMAQGKASLMPLMLILRTVTPAIRTMMLRHLGIPVMVMLRTRIHNSPQDDGARLLAERIRQELETRQQRGESVHVRAVDRRGLAGVGTVQAKPPPAAHAAAPPVRAAAPRHSAPEPAGHGEPAPVREAPRPEARPLSGTAPEAAADSHSEAPAAPAAADPLAKSAVPAAARAAEAVLDQRVVLSWRQDGESIAVQSISARDVAAIAGKQRAAFTPWVQMAIQTSQVFGTGQTTGPDAVDKLVAAVMVRLPPDTKARLSADQVQVVLELAKSLPPHKYLLGLVKKAHVSGADRPPGWMIPALESLGAKFKENLTDFVSNPSKEEYRDLRVALAPVEKLTVVILQRVGRLQ